MGKPVRHRGKWRIRWIDERETRQSAVFDDYKRAQTELSRKQVEVEEIKRGIRNAPPPQKTFNDLFDYWIEKRAPRKRSQKDDESIIRKHLRPRFGQIRKHLRPRFGQMLLRNIGVEDGDDYVGEKVDDEGLGEKTVSNHLTLLTTMMNAAATFKVPWILRVPKFHKPKVALFGRDYQWLRNDDEVRRFLAATQDEDEHVSIFYTLAIFSGMRAGEIAALEWCDVNFDRRLDDASARVAPSSWLNGRVDR